jgi:SAM-dependent methyltransferase
MLMGRFRTLLKDVFYKAGLVNVLDFLLFKSSQFKNKRRNECFRKQHPELTIPPDYFLYETYLLDYEQFYKDGELSAKEIIDWTGNYLNQKQIRILDFGCGVSRIVVHLKKFTNAELLLYGCDVNGKMIEYNRTSFKDIFYSTILFTPPTDYKENFFDLLYAISIFTHIPASLQGQWLKEIDRVLKVNGIFLLTTHGNYFKERLLKKEQEIFDKEGAFTKEYRKEGHRMMSTYNSPESFRKLLITHFEILEYYDGSIDMSKAGGQDLWIVKKRKNNRS